MNVIKNLQFKVTMYFIVNTYQRCNKIQTKTVWFTKKYTMVVKN